MLHLSISRPVLVSGLALLGGFGSPSVHGQPAVQAVDAPTHAQARVPPLVYASSLARYRPLVEVPAPSGAAWAQAHAQVLKAGGWRAYAREKAPPSNPPQSAQEAGHAAR